MNVLEAFNQLNRIYELNEKKNTTQVKANNKDQKDEWLKFFYTFEDINFPSASGNFIPLVSKEFISSYRDFVKTFGEKDEAYFKNKLLKDINSVDIYGKPLTCKSEKINGIDHVMYEMKVGQTYSNKPIRVLYFPKMSDSKVRYLILTNLIIHTKSNLSAAERNSGKNAYKLANYKE